MSIDAELDLDDLPPKVLRKMLRQMLGKLPRSEEQKEKDESKEDKELTDLADLKAETTGKPPEIPVTKEDLPEGMAEDDEDEMPPKKAKKGKK